MREGQDRDQFLRVNVNSARSVGALGHGHASRWVMPSLSVNGDGDEIASSPVTLRMQGGNVLLGLASRGSRGQEPQLMIGCLVRLRAA